jgi:Na+-driven multidrug efflux pump
MMGANGQRSERIPTRKDSVTTATAPTDARSMPPVLGRLMSGTFWMALRTPLQAVLAFFSIPLIIGAIGPKASSAYAFAWGFGFFQFLFEFGMSSSLQRQASETWTRGDRAGVDRVIACGMNFYAAMAVVQVVALLGVAYLAVPYSVYDPEGQRLIVKLLWLQVFTTPCFGLSMVALSVLRAARRHSSRTSPRRTRPAPGSSPRIPPTCHRTCRT